MTSEPKAPAYEESGDQVDDALLPRLERLAFLLLDDRSLSARAATAALGESATDPPGHAQEWVIRAALQLAARYPTGSVPQEDDAPAAYHALTQLDIHSRSLLLGRFSLDLPAETLAEIVEVSLDSLDVNLVASMRRYLAAMGRDALSQGCGAEEETAVVRQALGLDPHDETGQAHLDACPTCPALAAQLREEGERLSGELAEILKPDLTEHEILQAAPMIGSAMHAAPLNLYSRFRMSKNSCLGLAMILGLAASAALYFLTEIFFSGPLPDLGGTKPAVENGTPKTGTSSWTFDGAVKALASPDEKERTRAANWLIRQGRSHARELARARHGDSRTRAGVEKIFLTWAREENRKQETAQREALSDIESRVQTEAWQQLPGLRKGADALAQAVTRMETKISDLRKSGVSQVQLASWQTRLAELKNRHDNLRARIADASGPKREIRERIKAELEAKKWRYFYRRRIMNVPAAIRIVLGKKPVFSPREAWQAQRNMVLPGVPMPSIRSEAVVRHVSQWVDFPILIDPALHDGRPHLPGPMGQIPQKAETLLEAAAAMVGGRLEMRPEGVLLAAPKGAPRELLDHFRKYLNGSVSPTARSLAAWGIDTMTWKSFGFRPEHPLDDPGNQQALGAMRSWFQAAGRIRFDETCGKFGRDGEGI